MEVSGRAHPRKAECEGEVYRLKEERYPTAKVRDANIAGAPAEERLRGPHGIVSRGRVAVEHFAHRDRPKIPEEARCEPQREPAWIRKAQFRRLYRRQIRAFESALAIFQTVS